MVEVKINGVVKWQVNEYTFNDPQMGIRSINMTVKHPSMWVDGVAPDTADFTGAYVDYEGEKYSISSSKPTAEKSNTSLDYIYTLIFKGEEDELTRRKVRNLALVSGDNYVSQGTTFSIYADINQFKQLLENNLRHYFGNKWSINLSVLSSDSVRIDVSNVTLWDLLSKTYEYFGVRFNIRGNTINIGYEPEEIYHVFDYGSDGGLIKITKTAPDTSIVNRLSGVGGSRNVPMNYFTDRYSEFDPDPNPINSSVNIRNIMPKVFRDSVVLGDYKDYVEDLASIASHGVREDALAPNEDIYPSIAGVEVSGLGRIDEIIAVSEVIADKPDDENYSPTFHIWVKDIGFNLADEQYTSTQDAKISFTTGILTGYEFTILANGQIREVVEDTTKSFNGVSSKYRITLINSDEDFDATGRVLPNTVLKPSAGDHFVIYDIEMPFSYVANAEQRVQDWLEANLADLKDEKPTFSIEPMASFFETAPVEFDGKTIKEKLRAGNRITVNADIEHRLHINNLTIQYGGLMPKYSFTVTDRVQVQGGAVARLQSQLDGVMSRQMLAERDIEALLSGFSTKYLSKVKPDIAQQFISFLKGISVKDLVYLAEGLEIGNYTSGLLGSGAKFKMNEGISELEVDKLSVRMRAEFFSVLIHQAKHIGGELIISAADMICIKVEEFSSFYRCYFDRGENNEVNNLFTNQDRARCQVFTGAGQKFYWRKVLAVGSDYIELSKTDASPGTNDIPEVGDHIFQLGSDDIDRQGAMIFSSVGADAPSFKQYAGINGYSLVDKETTVFTSKGNRIQGKTVFTSGGSNLDDYLDSTAQDIEDAQAAANAAALKAQQAIDEAEANVGLINTEVGKLQAQIDGEVSNWFYPYSPTLANYPASDWTTNAIKDRHIGDTFTSIAQAPATDAGKSWRFVKNGTVYSWTQISDSDAVLALQKAAQAQAAADGKSTTHLLQPIKYSLGDMWVLNADQTVNGTAYKQGEILTATQDSATFVQAHWVKKVRYTDDSAVNNMEIGSRNLLLNSGVPVTNSNYPTKVYNLSPIGQTLVDGEDVTVVIKGSLGAGKSSFRLYNSGGSVYAGATIYPSEFIDGIAIKTFKWIKGTASNTTIPVYPFSNTVTVDSTIEWIKLVRGNKTSRDWTEAQEDVQARIDAAKTEAENAAQAYADTKSEAERVLAEAYADGKVSAEEQARIDDVNAKLAAAKAHAEAQDALLKTQQEAYADGKISTAEQAAIDAAKDYADLKKTEAQAYADGIVSDEEARAIADALDKFNASKAHAEQLVKDIEIGVRNLILQSQARAEVTNGSAQNWVAPGYYLSEPLKIGQKYTFYCEGIEGTSINRLSFRNPGSDFDGVTGNKHTFTATAESTYLYLYLTDYSATYKIGGIKLVKGDKCDDWTEAPEDVEASILQAKQDAENASKAYADTKSEAERVLAEAYADGKVSAEEQARIDDVNAKLAAAKAHAEAQDALLKTQQEAYADGKISTAEQAAIDAAKDYADLKKTEAQAYADGIVSDEEARAIADALDKFNASKAHAEQLVNNLEIGGRNLIAKKYIKDWNLVNSSIVVQGSDAYGEYLGVNQGILYGAVGGSSALRDIFQGKISYNENTQYALKVRWKIAATQNYPGLMLRFNYSDGTYSGYISLNGSDTTLTEKSIISEVGKTVSGISCLYGDGANRSLIYDIQMTEGNKHTAGYLVAPEDVEANIATAKTEAENAAQAYADTKSEAERVLAEAYADGKVSAEEQARIDDVNAKLAAAKAHAEAQDALLKTQQEAYADGKISTAEQAAINAAKDYADLKKTEVQAYADGIVSDEEARAIADALDKFNASKAHAEQLVNNLEIGGRNLLTVQDIRDAEVSINNYSALQDGYLYGFRGSGAVDINASFLKIRGVIKGNGYYTISFKMRGTQGITQSLNLNVCGNISDELFFTDDDEFTNFSFTTKVDNYSKGGNDFVSFERLKRVFYLIDEIKLEKGNKPTDWTEAPEDVEARIETAKKEAENAAQAYADTKSEAERVLAEAYADGKVSAEEQARIDDVNAKLAAAKAYADAQDALLKTQQEAYADGKISTAEQAAINAAKDYADLKKTEAQAYADGIVSDEEARAIADALDKFNASKAHAETLVNNLEIGGRNLITDSTNINILPLYGATATYTSIANSSVPSGAVFTATNIIRTNGDLVFFIPTQNSRTRFKVTNGERVTVSFYIKTNVTQTLYDTFWSLNTEVNSTWKRVQHSFIYPASGNLHYGLIGDGLTSFEVHSIKMERGNKATDWTEAPEDTDKKISDVDIKAIEALAKANISKAITDKFGTTIDGGLINTVTVELREADTQDVTAFISGIQGALKNLPAFGAGGSYADALANLAKIIFRHDGSGQLAGGLIKWTEAGDLDIGNMEVDPSGALVIRDEEDTARLIITKDDVTPLADIGSSVQNTTINNTDLGFTYMLTGGIAYYTQGNKIPVYNNNTNLSVSTSISIDIYTGAGFKLSQARGRANVYLKKVGYSDKVLLGEAVVQVDKLSGEASTSMSGVIPLSKNMLVSAGMYEIVAEVWMQVTEGDDALYTLSGILGASVMKATFDAANRRTEIGKNGIGIIADAYNYLCVVKEGSTFKSVARTNGLFDMPGVLAAGSVSSDGVQANVWGAKSNPAGAGAISGGRSVPLANMKHDNYVVQITPHTATTFRVGTKTTSSFQAIGTGGFDYVVIGNNY